ncbi:hypothetical protein [Mucilaginibacter ginsenosidivorax]|uniref:Uncharacterized protein n=1 Tax=Mucilaginibacter ginsenosidivorax TaxID=862126 RepID=A0A5B8W6N3_9SPHI|nr:hypothetical protein [Mucilaginibacter ginsenosidivorax]QEC78586.1 hypothetical protein FSB76_22525 [Mucilaginibacter ginsenosidivorax]
MLKIKWLKNLFYQVHFGKTLIWPLIEAEYLRGGRAEQGCRKKYDPERSAGVEIFYSGTCLALAAEEV